jgi:hypothetical protein
MRFRITEIYILKFHDKLEGNVNDLVEAFDWNLLGKDSRERRISSIRVSGVSPDIRIKYLS